jgi:uncharacterized membrane protein
VDIITNFLQILGIVYVVFLPGYCMSFLFFARSAINSIERFAFSIALTIAVVPIIIYYLNLIGIKVSKYSIIIEVSILIASTTIIASRTGKLKGSNEYKDNH